MEGGNLVLSRKEGDTIRIGDSIVITVTEVRSQGCTLAINAPRSVRIVRGEIDDFDATGPQDAGRQ